MQTTSALYLENAATNSEETETRPGLGLLWQPPIEQRTRSIWPAELSALELGFETSWVILAPTRPQRAHRVGVVVVVVVGGGGCLVTPMTSRTPTGVT